MKKTIYFLLIFCLFQTSSCKKEFKPDTTLGTITALKNGEEWIAEIALAQDISDIAPNEGFGDRFDIIARVYNKEGLLRESLNLKRLPKVVATYTLGSTLNDNNGEIFDSLAYAGFGTAVDGGDILGDYYHVVEELGALNHVTITSFDEEEQIAKGTFQATFYQNLYSNPDNLIPDTIRFENGVFEVYLQDYSD